MGVGAMKVGVCVVVGSNGESEPIPSMTSFLRYMSKRCSWCWCSCSGWKRWGWRSCSRMSDRSFSSGL